MICVCKLKNWEPGCNSVLVWRSENQGNWWCSSWSESKSPRIRGTGCVRTGEIRCSSFSKERTNLPSGGIVVKNLPANCKRQETQVGSLGLEDSLWSRKRQPTPLFLPLKSHGQRRQVGYSPWGCRVWHDWTAFIISSSTHMGESDLPYSVYWFKWYLWWPKDERADKTKEGLGMQEQKNQTHIDLPFHPQWCNY